MIKQTKKKRNFNRMVEEDKRRRMLTIKENHNQHHRRINNKNAMYVLQNMIEKSLQLLSVFTLSVMNA